MKFHNAFSLDNKQAILQAYFLTRTEGAKNYGIFLS